MPMKQLQIAFTDRQVAWIRSEASRLGVTASEVVRRVLDAAIDAHSTKSRGKSAQTLSVPDTHTVPELPSAPVIPEWLQKLKDAGEAAALEYGWTDEDLLPDDPPS